MSYSVGSVEVSVFPNAQEFYSRLQGQVAPQADKLGQQIGDTLAQQIAQGIRKGLGDFPSDNPAKDPAKRKGDEAAGAFGDAFKARMRAALADLPKIEIGVAATEAEQKLRDITAEMKALGDARIGVDLSDTEALAKLDELKAKLAEIGASSDSARVKVDTAAATAELAKFQVELDRINGETATAKVKVDDGGGLLSGGGGISSLTGALMTVAPAIVPIGAAALAGAAALGTMAAAGAGAAGVLAIAFSGVSKAVTLLGQQQTQQAAADAAAGAGATQRAQAIVSAQRQMTSAQMALGDAQRNAAQQEISDAQAVASAQTALGDARRNAANQQITDAQAVVSAQQSLAQANDQVTLAQKALTDAQEAGRRELESFANNAADASLAQQQAAISLEQTQATAAKTMASSTATDLQKRQAALDVAKAQQSLTEANQRVTESSQDNTKAQAAGVSGTQAVVSAQKQVASAQDGQRQAAQGLADAQRKASQDQISSQESIAKAAQALASAQQRSANDQISSHESIVRAQQGVAAAADAMAAAQQQSAGTTNAALAATNDAIAKLDPATRNFAEYLRGTWTPIWHNIQSAAAAGLLPGVQAGMDALMPLMPTFTGIVSALASTMGDLFEQAGKALASPFWANFFQMIQRDAGPLLSDLGHIIGNVVTGFAGIVQAFMPLTLQIGGGLDGLTQKFAAWGQGLATSQGFHDFVDYVHREWPVIKDVIENVATAVGHIVQAGGILGGPTLELLRTLSGILAGLPVGVVVAMVGAFEGFKIFQTINGPLSTFTKSLSDLSTKLEGKAGLLGSLGSGLGTAASAAGPAAAGIGFAAIAAQEWVQAGAAAKDVAVALGRALEEGGNQANAAAAYIQKFSGVTDLLNHSAGLGDVKFMGTSFRDLIPSAQGATKAYDDWYAALSPSQKLTEDVSRAQQTLNDAIATYGQDSPQAKQAASDLAGANQRAATQQAAVAQATRDTNSALEALISTQQTQASATLGLEAGMLNTSNQIDNYKAHLNDATLSAADHKLALNQVEQSMLNVVDAAKKKADADNAGKSPAQLAQAEVAAQRDALDKLVGQLGFVPPALKDMYDQLNGPQANALANAQAQTDNYKQAIKNLGDATNGLPYQHGIAVTADVQAARDAITGLTNDYHNYSINVGLGGAFTKYAAADGGVLPGWSPGKDIHTFTSPTGGALALSGGEAVMRPEFTAAVGTGWVNSVNAAARSGGSSGVRSAMGFADGGVIPWNPWSMVAKVGIDPASLAAAEASFGYTPGGPIALPPGGAVERWRAVVDQALTMLHQPLAMDNGVLSLIRSESGGNPNAINLTDSNARAGHPSRGLMQTIPTTFEANRSPLLPDNIVDPLANIYAGINYALRHYGPGMLMAGGRHDGAGRYIGYDSGGLVSPGYHMLYNGTGGNEVIAPQQTFREVVNQMHSEAPGGSGNYTVIAQFGSETIQATAVRVVDDALGDLHNTMHYAGG